MSDEWERLERTLRDKGWQRRVLEHLQLAMALDHDGFARTVCEDVAAFARRDRDLTELIQNGLKLKRGEKRNPIPTWWPTYILEHYAGYMRQGQGEGKSWTECEEEAIARLIESYAWATRRQIEPVSMDNQISDAVEKVALTDLAEWARPIIKERKRRGEKYHKAPR